MLRRRSPSVISDDEIEYVFIDTCRLQERGFCTGCYAIKEEPDIHYTDCPVGWDMCNADCVRYTDIQEIIDSVRQINCLLGQVCRDNDNYGDSRDDYSWN